MAEVENRGPELQAVSFYTVVEVKMASKTC
jgi:hypothetical protein